MEKSALLAALPDQSPGGYIFDPRHNPITMKHHGVEEIGDDAGVVGDNADFVADLRAMVTTFRQVDDAVFFRKAGDDSVGVANNSPEVCKA